MKKFFACLSLLPALVFGQYAPVAGFPGTTAIHKDSSAIIAWANEVVVQRGYLDIQDTTFSVDGTNKASFGIPENAVGPAQGNAMDVVSLGDGGEAVLYFNGPILNGPGPDFAVFENSFASDYLELAYVEVSSDGQNFVRFPSHSLTQTQLQISGFGSLEAIKLNNLAGKYKGGYGTPFDLEELVDSTNLDLNNIQWVKIIDVVGTIGDSARYDSHGNKINDPYPTPYPSGGFDLDGVAQLHGFVGLDEVVEISFTVYPNPSKGKIHLRSEHEISEISLYDLQGSLISSQIIQGREATLNLELNQGIYLLIANIDGQNVQQRISILN
ncbi:Por secretion system C-terminal sorting domain-containing protein [Lishizhenia tianjinensis]|uniref:Por secretion system C-terminal sorting domain-containing protein n=1 Tax=Lishizhenia tianjinensis TaxID=477690 RepID=A0A1I6YYF6_9FLAO|nr:T9SS type A sorting domain-containing protein [Lishizhenia tianjinensis]SFT55447.1 Por secretion system C-terminal sorting domain-containing protein [Lishizhenia tianjinensis]